MNFRTSQLFLILASLSFFACQNNSQLEIEKVEETFVSREGAKVYFSYPRIESGPADSIKVVLNEWMKNIAELREKKVAEKEFTKSEADIVYEYSILFQNDSLLSLENRTIYQASTDQNVPIVYRPIIMNHQNGNGYIAPESLWPNFERSKLIPYLEKTMSSFHYKPNMNAYKEGSGYLFSFAMTEDSLIVYPGNEGEFFSYDRLPIAFSELQMDTN
ncbi:hypothetical protein [Halocola ammonii]